ncbi:MAG: IS607 family transposase [Vulcanimicrobiaceae bacterium]
MKLATWAKRQGIASCTAWRWVRHDRMPVPWRRTPTGTILVDQPVASPSPCGPVALYVRASSNDQKHDLERQLGRLTEYATRNGMSVVLSVGEIGSGLNGHRPKLRRLLADPLVHTIVVEHRNRLARFGSEYLEAALHSAGRTLVVVDASEMRDDLVQDMIDVLTSFCARLYGRRSARRHAQRAVAAMEPTSPAGDATR